MYRDIALWKGIAELEQSRRKMVAVFVAILCFAVCLWDTRHFLFYFVTKLCWESHKGGEDNNLDLERDGGSASCIISQIIAAHVHSH